MRRSVVTAVSILLLAVPAASAFAQSATFAGLSDATGLEARRYEIDRSHSAVEFVVRFMGISNVRGAFADVGGTVMYDSANIANSSVSVVIATASINTNSQMRDRDLRSANFFDAEKFPRITFHSTAIERAADGFVARGPLTMHGVTKEVVIPFRQTHGPDADAWRNLRMGFVGSLELSRKEFGILGTKFWNSEYDPGRMSISDEVRIDLNVEVRMNNVDKWTAPRADSLIVAMASHGPAALAAFRTSAADTASDLFKSSEQLLSMAGFKLMHARRFADAVAVWSLATDLHPATPELLAALGEAQLMSGKRDAATRSFERAIALDATNHVAGEYLRRLRGKRA